MEVEKPSKFKTNVQILSYHHFKPAVNRQPGYRREDSWSIHLAPAVNRQPGYRRGDSWSIILPPKHNINLSEMVSISFVSLFCFELEPFLLELWLALEFA